MKQSFLSYKTSRVCYYRFGAGQQLVICFHGYGENAAGYQFLEKYAGERFTFFSIDLPFHGATDWKEGLNFSDDDLQKIIEEILHQNNFKLQTTNIKLTLMGFSLGGRVALSLYEVKPAAIEKMILLAPDGLKINFWYRLSTQTWIGNKLFNFTMKHPGWFFGILKIMNRLGLVNTSIFKFVTYYIDDRNARRLLYERWISLRKLKPNLKKIKSLINQQKTETRLLYGKHDRIILSSRGEKFRKGIEEHCTLNIINSGHQVLHEKHAAEIVAALFN